jgi:hypothetical protein
MMVFTNLPIIEFSGVMQFGDWIEKRLFQGGVCIPNRKAKGLRNVDVQ